MAQVCTVQALSPHTPRENFPSFDKDNDILIAQFDSLPDPDDIHAQAALGSMLIHPDLAGVEVFAVLGAIGEQGSPEDYKDPWDLMELIYGAEGDDTWTDAWDEGEEGENWNLSVDRVKNIVKPILQNGGKVWVQEAGQSDITRDWIWELINEEGISESVIKDNVIVVQHSQWNHDQSNSSDLSYVKDKATFVSIDDGNNGGHKDEQTPDYNIKKKSFLEDAFAGSNPNKTAQSYWHKAKDVIDREGSSGGHATIGKGGVDCSDCVENWWIFEIGENADTLQKFFDRYVTNEVAGPVVDAGADSNVQHSTTSASLTATIIEDGGNSLTYAWSQVSGPATSTISSPASLTTDVTLPETGSYTFRFTGDDGENSAHDDVVITRQIDLGNILYAINCGGDSHTAASGIPFEADNYSTSGDTYTKSHSIEGTTDDVIFSSERFANAPATVDYAFPVTNGNYEVKLMWSENTASGRLMDVVMEGSLAIDALDVLTLAGAEKTAYEETVQVSVDDGELNLSISANSNATENYPNIMGIIISAAASNPSDNASYNTYIGGGGYELSGDDALPSTDYDEDGLSNLEEFAQGLDPTSPDSAGKIPETSIAADGEEKYLEFTYRRRKNGSGTTGVDYTSDGVTYTVEVSDDLVTWSSDQSDIVVSGQAVDNGDGTESVTVRLASPVSAKPRRFMRLKMTQ